MSIWFQVKALRSEDARVVYLTDQYVGDSDNIHKWVWSWPGELFWTKQEAKAKLRTNVVRELRAVKCPDRRPVWKIQIVQVDSTNGPGEEERVVWPIGDIPVLDRLAEI